MKTIKISIAGLGKVKKLNPVEITRAIAQGMERAMGVVLQSVPEYPPTRPGQRYIRTNQLGQKIFVGVEQTGWVNRRITGWIGAGVKYAPWVISREETESGGPQAWMHAGRWWTLQEVVEKNAEHVAQEFSRALKNFVNSIGG